MQKFTQKYTIIQLFEDIPEGTQFSSSSWPLHSTIVDTFAVDWNIPTLIENLEGLLATHAQAISVVEDDEFFGPEKQTRVAMIRKTDDLVKLHYDVVELLEKGDLRLNNSQFARERLLPHATVQKHARLNKGDVAIFNALTLIDMFPDEDPYQRRVLKTIKIGSRTNHV